MSAGLTHPDFAPLVAPPTLKRKEGWGNKSMSFALFTACGREGRSSEDQVSRLLKR